MINVEPLVSVILPVYNGERYIADAVESILNQSYRNIELIVINDGSTDRSDAILHKYLNDHRVKYYKRENKGLVYTLNEALEIASGVYIARMDADDISMPNRIACQVSYLQTHPEIGLVGSNVILIDENGNKIGKRHLPHGKSNVMTYFLYGNPIAHPTVMFNKSILKEQLYYSDEAFPAEDLDLWLRCTKKGYINNVDDELVFYRLTKSGITSNNANLQKNKDFNLRYTFWGNVSAYHADLSNIIEKGKSSLFQLIRLFVVINLRKQIYCESFTLNKMSLNLLLLRLLFGKCKRKRRQ